MDINLVIRKGLVYSVLISLITIIYFLVVLIIEKLFHNYLNYFNLTSSLINAILIALIFIPLKNRIQIFLDRSFFKGTQNEIVEQNEQLRKEISQTEKLKSIAILASGLAHEIRNPMTIIKTFSEYLPSKIDDKDFLIKFSPLINNEIERINNLLKELLTFAKPSIAQLTPTNLNNIIQSTLDLVSNSTNKNEIMIVIKIPQNLVFNLDSNQFKQALLNIILNAVDAMPKGGTLTISTETMRNKFYLRIHDTGSGIAPSDIDHIFDPFYTKKDHGTGLGLSITHEIIKNHQGKIFVESKMNVGTAFIIELPIN